MSANNEGISDYEEEEIEGTASKPEDETISDYEDDVEGDGKDAMFDVFQGDEGKEEKPAEEAEKPKDDEEKEEPEKPIEGAEKPKDEVKVEDKPVVEEEKPTDEKKVWTPEFKTDADRAIYEKLAKGEQKEVWEMLNQKFAYESMPNEQKVIEFIKAKNPDFTTEEAMFIAETEYGIGAEKPTEEELALMDKDDKAKLMSSSIKLKSILREANTYFTDKATAFELPALPNPLETDEGYKGYLANKEVQAKDAEKQKAQKEQIDKTIALIDTTATTIKKLVLNDEINLDEDKFGFKVDLEITPKKQTQLAAFAKSYEPTKEEIEAHSKDGKLDMASYMSYLAEMRFSRSIIKAAVKQALSADRENFLSKELLNNKMGNNSEGLETIIEVDAYTAAMAE